MQSTILVVFISPKIVTFEYLSFRQSPRGDGTEIKFAITSQQPQAKNFIQNRVTHLSWVALLLVCAAFFRAFKASSACLAGCN